MSVLFFFLRKCVSFLFERLFFLVSIMNWQFVFQYFKMPFHFLVVSDEKLFHSSYLCFSLDKMSYFSGGLQDFSLFLVFSSFDVACLVLFYFSHFMPYHYFWKILNSYPSVYLFRSHSLFRLLCALCCFYVLVCVFTPSPLPPLPPLYHSYFYSSTAATTINTTVLFSFCSNLGSFYYPIFMFTYSFLSYGKSAGESFFMSVHVLSFLAFPFDSFLSQFHFSAKVTCAQLLSHVPTLWDPMDCSPPDSSVHGIF